MKTILMKSKNLLVAIHREELDMDTIVECNDAVCCMGVRCADCLLHGDSVKVSDLANNKAVRVIDWEE